MARRRSRSRRKPPSDNEPKGSSRRSPRSTVMESKKPAARGKKAQRRDPRTIEKPDPKERRLQRLKQEARKAEQEHEKAETAARYVYVGIGLVIFIVAVGLIYGPIHRHMLFKDLASKNEDIRATAAESLAAYDSAAMPGLLDVLKNTEEGVTWPDASRQEALRALILMNYSPADDALIEGIKKTKDPALLNWLLNAVTQAEPPTRFPPETFLPLIHTDKPEHRVLVAQVLGRHEGPNISEALVQMVQDPDPEVAKTAAAVLRRVARPGDASRVASLLQNPDAQIRSLAIDVLKALKGPEKITALGGLLPEAGDQLAIDILEIFQGMPSHVRETTPYVLGALKLPSTPILCKALETAGWLRIRDGYDAIVDASKHSNAKVRIAALTGARYTVSPALIKKLKPLLFDDDISVQLAAIETCSANPSYRFALGDFVKLLDHGRQSVSEKAMDALKKINPGRAKEFGNSRSKWKAWWAEYGKQLEELLKFEDVLAKALDRVRADVNNAGEAVDMVRQARKDLTRFQRRDDLVPELRAGGRDFERVEQIETDLNKFYGSWQKSAGQIHR